MLENIIWINLIQACNGHSMFFLVDFLNEGCI